MLQTFADVSDFEKDIGFRPTIKTKDGLEWFASWYKLLQNRNLALSSLGQYPLMIQYLLV